MPHQAITDVRNALRKLGGECCNVYLEQRLFDSIDPGSRIQETTWFARLVVREGRAPVVTAEATEKTARELVSAIRRQLKQNVTTQAADRRDSQVPPIVMTTTAPRRLTCR